MCYAVPMYVRQLTSDPDVIWIKMENLVEIAHYEPSWNQVAERMGCKTKKEIRAYHVRRRRRTANWTVILETLKVLNCNVYMLVPENNKDLEDMRLLDAMKSIILAYSRLREQDQKLVRALIKRLSDKPPATTQP